MNVITRSYYPITAPIALDRPVDLVYNELVPNGTAYSLRSSTVVPAGVVWVIRHITLYRQRSGALSNTQIGVVIVRPGGPVAVAFDEQQATLPIYEPLAVNLLLLPTHTIELWAKNTDGAARDFSWQLVIDEIDA